MLHGEQMPCAILIAILLNEGTLSFSFSIRIRQCSNPPWSQPKNYYDGAELQPKLKETGFSEKNQARTEIAGKAT